MLSTVELSVVIPSRNEAGNIRALLARLDSALAGTSAEYIIVDDSDDGTDAIARNIATIAPLSVLHRAPSERVGGLGGALRLGFESASGEWVCVLDADQQHPPEAIPALLRAGTEEHADLVVGSRYVNGGTAEGLTSPLRRVISRLSTICSRLLLFPCLEGVADSGSGFYLARRSRLPLARYQPTGFKSLMELLVRGRWEKVVEVPYQFANRVEGETKAGLTEGKRFLRHLLRLFLTEPRAGRVWKFSAVGLTGVAANLLGFWLPARAGLPLAVAWASGVELSVIWNFLLHQRLTFLDRTRAESRAARTRHLVRYHLSVLAGVVANALAFFSLTALSTPTSAALVLAILLSTALNYLTADRWAFRAPDSLPAADTNHRELTANPAAFEATLAHGGEVS